MIKKVTVSCLLTIMVASTMGCGIFQKTHFDALIYPVDSEPILIEKVNMQTVWIGPYFDVDWKGSHIKIFLKDVKTVRFLNPGKYAKENGTYDVELMLNNGSREACVISTPSPNLFGKSKIGSWSMNYIYMAKIEFLDPSP